MIIFNHFKDLQFYIKNEVNPKKKIGLVPTMGALHEGHFSLIENCNNKADFTICSIFVNPLQFNNEEDFKKYPQTLERDIKALKQLECDALILPSFEEMYPDKNLEKKHYALGYLENILEGKFRPGHFQGVCMAVERLLLMVDPDILFIGQKDFQQCMVIKKLINLMGKNIELVICPTLREQNGLAMSSRNLRLSKEEKETASSINQSLQFIKEKISTLNFLQLKEEAIDNLESLGLQVEYLELAKADDLELVTNYDGNHQHVILIAAYLNEVRLIDNQLIAKTKY